MVDSHSDPSSGLLVPGEVILGSQSPRRRELLQLLVPPDRIRIVLPRQTQEEGFDDCVTRDQVYARLTEIACTKNDDVFDQVRGEFATSARSNDVKPVLLTADTVVVVQDSSERPIVLGKPDGADWKSRTRHWFEWYYLGRTHEVATALTLRTGPGSIQTTVVRSTVRFSPASPELLEWYLSTGESLGKAGGYGLQGAADVFVEQVTGSLSNVIGLPLEATWMALKQAAEEHAACEPPHSPIQ